MELNKQTRGGLRSLMSSDLWKLFEYAKDQYDKDNFFERESIKRSSEFETIWEAAFVEGGRAHINSFLNQLEEQVNNHD